MIELAERKGNALTWDDFEPYGGEEIGSGLLIMKYPVDSQYTLFVTGVPDEIYEAWLVSGENSIDIRTEDVRAFLNQ